MKKFDFVEDPEKTGDEAVTFSDRKKRKIEIVPLIICFLIAFVVWFWMVNLNDTDATEVKLLTIEYIGMQEPVNGSIYFYGMDKTEISVTVQGSNRDLKKYDDSEYHAIVDLSGVDMNKIKDGDKVTLPINITVPDNSGLQVVGSGDMSATMLADIYRVASVPFDAVVDKQVDDTNTYDKWWTIKDNDGVEDRITISGPAKIVDTIKYARYNIKSDLLKENESFLDTKTFLGDEGNGYPLSFYDIHMNAVSGTDGIVTYSTAGAEVVVNVTEHKEIPVRVDVKAPIQGDRLITPSTIKISGKPSVLANIKEYVITMNSAGYDITYMHKVELPPEWLSDDVKLDNADVTIQITFPSTKDEE